VADRHYTGHRVEALGDKNGLALESREWPDKQG
jgi:hypothetical protein